MLNVSGSSVHVLHFLFNNATVIYGENLDRGRCTMLNKSSFFTLKRKKFNFLGYDDMKYFCARVWVCKNLEENFDNLPMSAAASL